ncbi:Pectinesterase QRT1 [Camellia lanceoleosa]|uniref:Pectinesterase QRT1 n=1 Tax=Camellia lanceoleosa TaxID=1840588 RepID=A0ACC0H013_9ERIC|nr:Pectinesterase QRT1 [Camellia lanceoleosa]
MNYITWEDMKVDLQKERLDLTEEQKRRRVIVVDQNGKGDSVTVQGAVDMVPLLSSQRVKIYIHSGIYSLTSSFPLVLPMKSLLYLKDEIYGALRMYVKMFLMWNSTMLIDGGGDANVETSLVEASNLSCSQGDEVKKFCPYTGALSDA